MRTYTRGELQEYHRKKLAEQTPLGMEALIKEALAPGTSDARSKEIAELFLGLVMSDLYPVASLSCYRARPWPAEKPLPTHIREFLAPPAAITIRGRCNLPRKPVLYVSNHPSAAMHETRIKRGETFLMVDLQRRPNATDVQIRMLGLSPLSFAHIDSRVQAVEDQYKDFCGDQYQTACAVRNLLHQAFRWTNEEAIAHPVTAYMADHVFASSASIDGIFYPSMAVGEPYANTAFRPNRWKKAYEAKVVGFYRRDADGVITQLNGGRVRGSTAIEWGYDKGISEPWPSDVARQVEQLRNVFGYESDIFDSAQPNPAKTGAK